jgi:hypothetical protein
MTRCVFGKTLTAATLIGLWGSAGDAATVLKGVLDPINGLAMLSNDGQSNPSGAIPAGKTIKVSFAIDQGVIAEVFSTVHYRYSYDIIPSDPNAVPFGNDLDGDAQCSFNGSGPDGCYDASYVYDSSQPPVPTRLISNLIVGQTSLSYDLFRPAGFDTCDQPVFDVECRVRWSVFNDFQFTVASRKPVGYTLRFGDPTGVPEPASWAMLITGFALAGRALRRPKRLAQA